MAKAIASGDPRLMQKAGLEAEISRLQRQRAAHIDDQQAVRRAVSDAELEIAAAERRIGAIEQDIVARVPTRGELFAMAVEGASYTERSKAGAALLTVLRNLDLRGQTGDWTVARIGGFDVVASRHRPRSGRDEVVDVALERAGGADPVPLAPDLTALGLVSRLEHALDRFEAQLAQNRRSLIENRRRLADYQPRIGHSFELQGELDARQAELDALEESLAKTRADDAGVEDASLDDLLQKLRCVVGDDDED